MALTKGSGFQWVLQQWWQIFIKESKHKNNPNSYFITKYLYL